MPRGIQGGDETPLQPRCIQRLGANETLQHLTPQTRVGRHTGVTQKMLQRFVDRPRVLLSHGI
jgi:hypothetical protein